MIRRTLHAAPPSSALYSALRLVALALVATLAGCAADRPDPRPLEDLTPKLSARQVWLDSIGPLRFPLVPAARGGLFIVAGTEGVVRALRAEDGREAWRVNVGAEIAAGVGSDGRHSSVVTRDNEVIAIEGGKVLWRKRITSSVVTPPFIAGERLFVVTVDRVVHAFDAQDGRRLWVYQKAGDALTLAHPNVLAAHRNSLIVGQGPRLAALDSTNGTLAWDLALAQPRGTNEVERLADLVGAPVRVGTRYCARAFQSSVACVDAQKGALMWSRNFGGHAPLAGDAQRLFGVDGADRITAWNAEKGEPLWTSEKFMYRRLSGLLAAGPVLVVGDGFGYVHFLSAETGETQLRLVTDGSAVIGTPVIEGRTVLVMTRDGGLFAFRQN
jgi:outer membrane assembly lipoprotein YfgL